MGWSNGSIEVGGMHTGKRWDVRIENLGSMDRLGILAGPEWRRRMLIRSKESGRPDGYQ